MALAVSQAGIMRDRGKYAFVVLSGTLMNLGDPPERVDVPTGGVVHVESGTVLQLGEPRRR